MRILVTGADGFVGRHLCRHLREEGDEVSEAHGPHSSLGADSLALDITQGLQVRERVAQLKPEGIIHLAGFSSVGKSHQSPAAVFAINTQGAVHLLEAVKREQPRCRVLLVGSGEMYGAVSVGQKAREDFPLYPLSPYAASKVAAEVAAFQFVRSYGLQVVSARPFNHLGPGQDASFVVPSFARQIASIQQGKQRPVLRVGDLTPIRDFSHVADVVRAYRLLLERGEAGTAYNVASGEGISIRGLLEEMLRLSSVSAQVEVDSARLRPTELPSLVGDPSRLFGLGFEAKRSRQAALKEVLEEAFDAER